MAAERGEIRAMRRIRQDSPLKLCDGLFGI
jgi:hypothetical protein